VEGVIGDELAEALHGAQVVVDACNAEWDDATVVDYSIVSATQFFEFMQGIADAATDGDIVRLPPVLTQPIAADDVASALARIAVSAPLNGVVELAGPDTFSLDELIRDLLDSHEDPRKVITDPNARYFGIAPSERALLPGSDARLGTTRFEDWSGGATTQLPQPVLVNGT
jgi:uncharacterized protein YbjT (DUF2867 family)